jgi:nucleoid DNA-binding protein
VNRSELGQRLGRRLGISPQLAISIVDAVFDEVAEATVRGEVVRVHRFGRFIPRVRAGGCKLPGEHYKTRLNQEAASE